MIVLKNVSKIYGSNNQVVALKNVNLSLEDSKLHLIIGQSGSGKTTLLNVISSLDSPTEGNVIIDGIDINNLNTNQKCDFRNENVGFVFQSYFLEPSFSVLENTCMPLTIRGVKRKEREEKAKEVLKQLSLETKINKKVNQLSGGEAQRVSIARALIGNPKLIFADEPTGNLDSVNGKNVMEILKDISQKGTTVIVVSHNLEYKKYADDVITISDGEVKMGLSTENDAI